MAKTLLSRSRVEVPKLALDVLAEWRKQTIYARDNDYVFPSAKLSGKCPRSASMLVEDYIRPTAIRARILTVISDPRCGCGQPTSPPFAAPYICPAHLAKTACAGHDVPCFWSVSEFRLQPPVRIVT